MTHVDQIVEGFLIERDTIGKSKRQLITTTSTCKSEFDGASLRVKDVLWVKNLSSELQIILDTKQYL